MIKTNRSAFDNTLRRLETLVSKKYEPIMHETGRKGVVALAAATPRDTGKTANSWSYRLERKGLQYKIIWSNSVMAGTAPLAILLQYGHGKKGGGFVYGTDYINPALEPVFKDMKAKIVEVLIQ